MILDFLKFSIKDGIILVTSTILLLCLLEIRRLKKSITQEIERRLIPQLTLELDETQRCFYLTNQSFFLAQKVKVEDLEITLDDLGYRIKLTLKFEEVSFVKPKERVKLVFKVFDKGFYSEELTEKIFPHLVNGSFKAKISYSNIENLQFRVIFAKEGNNFKSV